jgi:hypothetical protein
MAKSDRKCPQETCPMAGRWTNLSVCRVCHRATVCSIYQPKPAPVGWSRIPPANARRPAGSAG